MSGRRGVTVVVPMYGDAAALSRCLDALLPAVDPRRDIVLLVNDQGPEADEIEAVALRHAEGRAWVRYERNDRNLGFVGTCNRAAVELDRSDRDVLLLNSDTVPTPGFLDELSAVLHAAPDHGIVCPRSDHATIASLPHRLRDPAAARTAGRTATVHRELAPLLPRFSVAPVAMGFCFLVRRELVDAYGLFDPAFAPGYGEENDFCLRMRDRGYRSLIAHHALVFHEGARSFGTARRLALRAAHERLLVRRHPGYPRAVRDYLVRDADPVDVFADALVPADDTARVLVAAGGRPEVGVDALVATVLGAAGPDLDVTIAASGPVRRRLGRRYPDARVTDPRDLDAVFDLGIAPAPPTGDLAVLLHRTCLRWAEIGDLDASAADDVARRIRALARADVDLDELRDRWRRWGEVAAARSPAADVSPRRRVIRRLESRLPRAIAALRRVRAAAVGTLRTRS